MPAPQALFQNTRQQRNAVIRDESAKRYGKGSNHCVLMSAASVDVQWKDIDGTIRTTTWHNGVREISIPAFTGLSVEAVPSPNIFLNNPCSPLTCLRLFFPIEIRAFIVVQTNSYALTLAKANMRNWRVLTECEFDIWLSVLIYQGIVRLPSISDYWSKTHKTSFMQRCGISRDR